MERCVWILLPQNMELHRTIFERTVVYIYLLLGPSFFIRRARCGFAVYGLGFGVWSVELAWA